ncbi:MAG: KamA family radical SAM protein [Deltaproteobacteria bacterium]|nr:KamA family radical SAM protein [Deltaproteobacteria bacterium]
MSWTEELKNNIETIDQLKEYVDIPHDQEKRLKRVIDVHPMSITRYYASLINKNDPNDPIREMIVPSTAELDLSGTYDTSGEKFNTVLTGVQHKYKQTALILSTNRCTAYCRFCFRKRLVGKPSHEIIEQFKEAVKYVSDHEEITNVLISGGDPFILDTKIIKVFLDELADIDHLDFIRFGTRVPVVFPQRIIEDDVLVRMLSEYSEKQRQIFIVTHFNHPNELTAEAKTAVLTLRKAGLVINNQTVLFKGVNSNPETLAELMHKLLRMGINPYYVFQCRPVKRVKKHFQIPLVQAVEIVEKARSYLDGHGKRFRFIMSHKTGKIEIIGIIGDKIYLKYHQAKDPKNMGRFFKRKINPHAGWLDELESDRKHPQNPEQLSN